MDKKIENSNVIYVGFKGNGNFDVDNSTLEFSNCSILDVSNINTSVLNFNKSQVKLLNFTVTDSTIVLNTCLDMS